MSLYHEVIEALLPLIQAFDQLSISYYIGGSVSSSLHGLPRRTQDVDVIVDIPLAQVHCIASQKSSRVCLRIFLFSVSFTRIVPCSQARSQPSCHP